MRLWAYRLQAKGVFNNPLIGSDDTIYVSQNFDGLYALSNRGSLKWQYPLNYVDSDPSIGLDGTIYTGCSDGNMYAIVTAPRRLRHRKSQHRIFYNSGAY